MSTFQIIDPKSVENLQPILDAENVTLQWPRPEGKVDVYQLHGGIIKYLDNVIKIDKIKMSKKSFETLIEEQKKLMRENEDIMRRIEDRVKNKLYLY